jgi:type II secretory pathway pseudopilin PulG
MPDSRDWTDFNQSDPGITLLQLFAFLAIVGIFGVGLISIWQRRRRRRRRIH